MASTAILALAILLGLGSCDPGLYFYGNQNGPNCPIAPENAYGKGQQGNRCDNAEVDCAPACCECASGANSYWASECEEGICTSVQQACNDAPSSTLCK
jgi:hypothetical protein